jgi:hypothetical protein
MNNCERVPKEVHNYMTLLLHQYKLMIFNLGKDKGKHPATGQGGPRGSG